MGSMQNWVTSLKDAFSKSSLASNVAFGLILTGLEKIAEVEFKCPCSPNKNKWLSASFFVIPAVVAFLLMQVIQRCRCYDCTEGWWKFFYSCVPALMWLILLFLDGQYYVCASTKWEGRFVLDKEALLKWCKPITEENSTVQELMQRSHGFHTCSQIIGMGLLCGICIVLVIHGLRQCS